MTSLATPKHKNPCPGGHDIYNLGRPFLSHYFYKLTLSGLCLGVEKNNAFSLNELNGQVLAQEPLPHGS